MSKYRIIVNPTSGRGNGARSIPIIQQTLAPLGVEFDLIQTERPFHAVELSRQAAEAGYEVVVAAGGDGTANEVINGLMRARASELAHRPVMGILPVGRGNDFAYGVGMPDETEAACHTLANGHKRAIDVGYFTGGLFPEGRYFGNSLGIGFDAVVGFEAVKMTRLSGFVSYLVAALKTIFLYYKAPLLQIEYEELSFLQPAIMVSVMNGPRQGGIFFMSPQAKNDDGLFDICIAEEVSRRRIFTLIPHFFKGSQFGQPEVKFSQANRLVITAVQGVIPAHADGETVCTDGKELVIELLPRQLQVISPLPDKNA